jgi:hypothetical protein
MIRNVMKKLYSFILSFLIVATAAAQMQNMDSISRKFKKYREGAFQEKLFTHIDQDFYLTGELLWFRIFNVDGTTHKPSNISKVAFIELLDKNNKAMVQSKVALDANGGQGSLFIPAILSSGKYMVRVYTQWMRNFPSDYYFEKEISIVNPFVRPESNVALKVDKINAEFFPEGGNLVAGIRSRVAFKITNGLGESIGGHGAVVRNSTDTVAKFSPLKFGLGSFYLTPQNGASYQAFFTDNKGNTQRFSLPNISDEGYAMSLSDSAENFIKVTVKYKGNTSRLVHSFLFVHARQSIILADSKPIYPTEALFTIAKKDIPEGITHFTVFDENQKPVCERLYFRAPASPLEVQLTTDQTTYANRRKVSVSVNSLSDGKPLSADLSLSVFRADSLSSENHGSILAYLYLQSDLKGVVESPEYYFGPDAMAKTAADNLMLTHGWRRFKWDDVLTGKTSFSFIPEFRSHLITGKVTKADGSPAPGIVTYLSSPGKLVNVYGGRSNKEGLVHFEVRDFWGSRQLIFQTNTKLDSTYTLSINNPYDGAPVTRSLKPFELIPGWDDKLSARSLSMQVQDIYYREANDRIASVKNDSTAFYGQADETFNLDDYTRFPVMEEVMREYVPGVLVRKRRDGFHFLVLDKLHKGVLSGDPLVLIDGMPVFDVDKIMAFDPLNVRRLEVVTRNFYVGPLALPGIVSYSTYSGDLGGFAIDPKSVSINYEGLQLQREYYSPKYENQKQRASRLPDQRTLLHWIPQMTTGADGKKSFEFYSSDTSGDFIIVAHGLGKNGVAGTGIHKFTVKRADY